MVTVFYLLAQACGLSHREVADFLQVRPDTVKSWASGRRPAPPETLSELATLAAQIDTAAIEAWIQIENTANQHGEPSEIELAVATNDEEAQSLGWPCVGAQRASLGLVVARGIKQGYGFRVSPRGSTAASAAAADPHDSQR